MLSQKIDRVGETKIANNGLKMTIIAYRNCNDIDVQFEDEYIVTHKRYIKFSEGAIAHPNHKVSNKKNRVGETAYNKQNLKMTIVAYRRATDIDVQFDTGEIVSGRDYHEFQSGKISCPSKKKFYERVGETKVANNGMQMTLIAYRGSDDVDVQFSDGYINYHTKYYAFVRGKVGHPDTTLNAKAANNHYGETARSKHDRLMKIIRWGSKIDIDVEFEDGYVAKNKRYYNFKRGSIAHPNDTSIQFTDNTGATSISNKGQKMTVEVYRNSHDVDIRFEDGTLVTHKKYGDFVKGLIANPNYKETKYTGKSIISRDGINVEIIDAVGDKVYLQYETGYTTTRDRKAVTLQNYRLKHPYPYQIGDIVMESPAYVYNDVGNFHCRCAKCGHKDIWTISEMKEHTCDK